MKIRVATVDDAKEILDIYKYYITDTAITFEYDVPTVEEFKGRISKTLEKYPYIVCELDGKIVGYAYVSAFKERAAYDWSVETSIYVDKDCKGKGIGKQLYSVLEDICREMNIKNVNACIAYPGVVDQYLDFNSIDFHHHLGYEDVGIFHNCAYKFGTWYHMIWMEKMIGNHEQNTSPIRLFCEISHKL